ncbi:MAG TPA: GNAT family N-acetyltransferase [Burkholderiales bacterium]|nr:GNAT family N-acetyltransferase [Burkholderiales bacterium]
MAAFPSASLPSEGAQPQAAPVRVRVVTGPDAFAELATAWNALHERSPSASFVNAWIWQFEWWRAYGKGRPLRILVASRGDRIAGILPLYLDPTRRLGFPVTVARLVGSGGDTYPDDLGPVLDGEEEPAVARALAEAALELPEPDVLHLVDMDPATPFPALLEQAARGAAGLETQRLAAERIVFIALPRTWEAYLASVSGHRRARIRSVRKKLTAEVPVRFFVWSDPARINEAMDRLALLHRMRWEAAGEPSGSFASPEYIGFHRAVMETALRRGALRLYCLEVSGEIVAMLYAYRFRNRVYVVQAGFDPEHARRRIGQAILGYAIEHAIQEGNEVFDFLRGAHSYKDELGSGARETQSVTVLQPCLAAAAWRLRERTLPQLKRRLKALRKPAA